MNWKLYKKDDPSTWPKVDCPIIIAMQNTVRSATYYWDNKQKRFCNRYSGRDFVSVRECFYAYIGYIPSEYKTLYPTKCMREDSKRCAYEDDGYCMFESECEFAKKVAEYTFEPQRIWKEFE